MDRTQSTPPTSGRLARVVLAAVLLVGLGALLAACSDEPSGSEAGSDPGSGSADGGSGSGAQGDASDGGDVLAFAQCMRDNGVDDFPDPSSGVFTAGADVQNDPDFDTAMGACQDLLPNGGNGTVSGTTDEDLLAFAQCMRDNGVPDFPDPSTGGGVDISGLDPNTPQFQAALETCSSQSGTQPGNGQ